MKKITALLLALSMVFGLVACGSTNTNTPAPTQPQPADSQPVETEPAADGPQLSADGRYPAETVKIGFETFTTTDDQFLTIQKYFDYLDDFFNIEIIYSEALDSAEGELAFIEQCAAAGCKAIIGYYNVSNEEAVKLCDEKGMYYFGNGNNSAIVEYGNTTDAYLGSFYYENGEADYNFGYGCVEALAAAGCKKIILVSGGASFGVEMFIDRKAGAEAAAKDFGMEIVYEVPGWPGTEDFSAHQTNALATDADGIASMLTALMWIQPLNVAGKFGQIKVAAVDVLSETVVDMFRAGMYVGTSTEVTEIFGLSIPMILNAVTGHGDQQRNPDGTAPLINCSWWLVSGAEQAEFYSSVQGGENGWAITIDDMKTVLYDFNPDLTLDDMNALYTAMSMEDIQARHGN